SQRRASRPPLKLVLDWVNIINALAIISLPSCVIRLPSNILQIASVCGHKVDTKALQGSRSMPKLTDKLIRTLPPPLRGNRIVYDSEVRGFGVRLTYKRAVSFVLTYRTQDGIQRRLTIGSWPDWAVTTARQEAAKLKRAVDQGEDPLAARQAQRMLPTVSDLARRYLDEHAVPHKRASSLKDDPARLRRWVEPELGER